MISKSSAIADFSHIYASCKTSLGNTDLYNFYGIVIDASSPNPKKNFFRLLLKIFDPSMHYKHPRDVNDPNIGYISVNFFVHGQE